MTSQEDVVINVMESSTDQETKRSFIEQRVNESPAYQKSPSLVCIYKVSGKSRRANKACFTPRLVSIGPLHHGRGKLRSMEDYKLKCLASFLKRFKVKPAELVEHAAQGELLVRQYYQEPFKFKSREFTNMILMDGIFIVELLLMNRFKWLREVCDMKIFEKRGMFRDLLHDMLLLENQLPMMIIDQLLIRFVSQHPDFQNITSYDLALEFFKDVGNTEKLLSTKEKYKGSRHFVEFLLNLHAPEPPTERLNLHAPKLPSPFEHTRSAAELQKAGVKFSKGEGGFLFTIKFNKRKGELTIPTLTVNDSTETFFRNLIAFEQCGYDTDKYTTSYVILMASLINSSYDVDLLVNHGIIKNELGNSQVVVALLNNINKEVVTETDDFYFTKLRQSLNEYSRGWFHDFNAHCFKWKVGRWFRWKAILRRRYFGDPWTTISVFAASLLLIFTAIQTVCSILQVMQ